MSKLVWDAIGERYYETGTKKGVLYAKDGTGAYGKGVAWNGLTAVTESPSGADETKLYADDQKYLSLYAAEDFGCTIEAYTYPTEWEICDGSASPATGLYVGQQARRGFGFSYVTTLGNDSKGEAYGYKLHLIYNAMASPSQRSYSTINDSPDAVTLSWEVTTTPISFSDSYKPTACLTIRSDEATEANLAALEAILYGTNATEPRLPLPAEVISILNGASGVTGATGATTGTGN